jgi:O-antigen ligase
LSASSNPLAAPRPIPFLSGSPVPLVFLSALAALLVGLAVAVNQIAGLSLLVALCYVPLVLINLPIGIALWVPLAFLGELALPLPVGAAAGLLVVFAWLGTVRERESAARHFIAGHHRLLGLLGLLIVWVTVSALWADDLGRFGADIWHWYTAALLFVVVATSISREREARWLVAAFVAGAVLSVALGLANSGNDFQGRFYGGSGDPNYSAAGFLAGIILAAGLLGGTKRPESRLLLVIAMTILAGGLAATQSRGAFVGAIAATIAALMLYRGRRGPVLAVVGVALSVAALIFSVSPSGWQRLTQVEDDEPRSELWLVAWRMSKDHPVTGVGLNNFSAQASDYVREPGSLHYVDLIADDPHVVHNSALQVLADTGAIGLVLYATFALSCLAAAIHAGRRFEAARRMQAAGFARSVAVAIVAMLSVSLFLSNVTDERTWLLLALGPTLLAIATGQGWRRSTSTP